MVRTKALDGAHHPLKPMKQSDCRWVSALETSEFGLIGVVGGMTMIELLAYTMRSICGGIAAVGNEGGCIAIEGLFCRRGG